MQNNMILLQFNIVMGKLLLLLGNLGIGCHIVGLFADAIV